MAKTRKTHKKKIYHYSEDGVKNPNIWIEVSRLDELTVESGRGFHYQKSIYHLDWKDEQDDGTWATSKGRTTVKRITNPDNPNQWVDMPVIDEVAFKFGRGHHYQKTVHHFDNSEENTTRITHTKTVRNKEDPTMRLDVEVIEERGQEFGRGFVYQKTINTYNDQGEEQET